MALSEARPENTLAGAVTYLSVIEYSFLGIGLGCHFFRDHTLSASHDVLVAVSSAAVQGAYVLRAGGVFLLPALDICLRECVRGVKGGGEYRRRRDL